MPPSSGSLSSHPSPKECLPIHSQLYSDFKLLKSSLTAVFAKWVLSPRHGHSRVSPASPLWKVGARPFQVAVLSPPVADNLGARLGSQLLARTRRASGHAQGSRVLSPSWSLGSTPPPGPGPRLGPLPLADWGCVLSAPSPGAFFPGSLQLWEVSAPGPQGCHRRGGSIACGWSEKSSQGKGYLPTYAPPPAHQGVPLRPTPSHASEQHCGKKQTGS